MRLWFLPGSMVMLSLLSLLLLKSVAPTLAPVQLIFFLIGLVVFWVTSRFSYSFIEQWRWPTYVILCFLLALLLIFGSITRGIAGWIYVGSLFSIQPSQLAIPIVSLIISHFLAARSAKKWSTLLLVSAIAAVPGILILVEPDLGTAAIYMLTVASMIFISPIPVKYLLGILGAGLILVLVSWLFILKPYQKSRITSFVGSGEQNQTANYNAQQALIAVGSGEITGRGLGEGVQSHLRFLPERQTDFIFASLAEELGLIGSLVVIGLYLGISLFCIYIAVLTTQPAHRYFCIAAGAMILFQAGINIGMNMGLLPITGITLPLLSYGGSSIIAICLVLGIVQSITLQTEKHWHLHLT